MNVICTPRQVAGLVIVAALSATAAGDVIELVSINEEAGGNFGTAVSGIPDVDGDGLDDIIVGASEENGGGVNDAGRVYIHSGRTGGLIRAHSSPNDSNEGDYGISVAGVEDLNGDGRGDYIVGASGELGFAGRVYVYSGATGALLRTHSSPNSEPFGAFGRSVAAVPDFTNDGRGDYIIGAPAENGERGRAYVYSGSSGLLSRTHNSPNAEPGGWFGFSVAGVPDADFDSRGEYVIGAPYEDPGGSPSDNGRAYLYSGFFGGLEFTFVSGNPEVNGKFGWSVGGVPDVGGNGGGDVIVGAPGETVETDDDDFSDGGRAYLYSGTGGFLAHTYEAPEDDQHTANQFGWSVAGMPDRTGDDRGEIIVGAPGWPSYDVYVFEGTNGFGLVVAEGSPDGFGANQLWGGAVAAAGDANGDGRGDFIVGGKGSDEFPEGPSESGRAYLFRSPVPNDFCGAFTTEFLSLGPNPFTNVGANGSSGSSCALLIGSDVWFRYVSSCNGPVRFSTCDDADFDTVIEVYAGCLFGGSPVFPCQLGPQLACSHNGPGCQQGSIATVDAVPGQCFYVRVAGLASSEGTGVLTVSCDCIADVNGDGTIDGADLGVLLGEWGGPGIADLDGNGTVDGADLGLLLSAWGPCQE